MKNKVLTLSILLTLLIVLFSCRSNKKVEYELSNEGYYFKLISFEDFGSRIKKEQIVKIAATFKTQSDSVFWDSYNNLSDHFYIQADSANTNNLLAKCVVRYTLADSVCMLMKSNEFFWQQFNTSTIPFFSQSDSVVKINFKILKVLSQEEFAGVKLNHLAKEMERIEAYYGSHQQVVHARDSMGFYWVDKPQEEGVEEIHPGDVINITYQGYFLNGRLLEKSPQNFDLSYGTPDQVLKGINYVIGRLKVGQSAKIILPSHLAFGEKGSSNGSVPPFTALAYEIKINAIKK